MLLGCIDAPSAPSGPFAPNEPSLALVTEIDSTWNRHIVVLRKTVPRAETAAVDLVSRFGGTPFYVYEHALKGYAVANISDAAIQRLKKDPLVEAVFPDTRGEISGTRPMSGPGTWGLDRIDKRAGLDNLFTFFQNGAGVHIYVIDTGIRAGHQEFAGRVGAGHTCLMFSLGASPNIDQSGHGTGVASIAAGTTVGVASGATIHSVRINDNDQPWTSDAACGLDWVAQHAQQPAVATMSSVYDALVITMGMAAVVANGTTMIKAVGESFTGGPGVDACSHHSESNFQGAIRVSATDIGDNRATFADYGPCVDVFAPGQNIRVASHTGDAAYSTTFSGTSAATPFVAGVAALIKQQRPWAGAADVKALILNSASPFNPPNLSGSPPRLLYSLHTYAEMLGNYTYESQPYTTYATWYADVVGGNGSWTYLWELSWNGHPFQVVGSGPSYTYSILPNELSVHTLRLTATSGLGDSFIRTNAVHITPAPGCGMPTC